MPTRRAAETVHGLVAERVARVLGLTSDEIDPRQGFFSLGIDSIMIVELIESLRDETGLGLSHAAGFEYACVDQLARFILDRLFPSDEVESAPPALATHTPVVPEATSTAITAEIVALDEADLRSFINTEVESILKDN